jgi:hypothetical protein
MICITVIITAKGIKQMGVRSTLIASPVTAAHAAAAFKVGVNAGSLVVQLQEQINETILLLREVIKGLPTVNLSAVSSWTTASTTLAMSAPIPAIVVAGMNVFDITNSKQIGTVLSANASTLTLTAAAANASSGSNDVLQITDANLSVYNSQIAALQ